MKTLIEHYDKITSVIEEYDLDTGVEDCLVDILELIEYLIIREVKQSLK